MQVVTADWETYYDKDYSLSKLTTEEYVRDDRFEAIMLGLRWPDGSTQVITGTHPEIQYQLDAIDWGQYAVLCHNTMFDAAIFAWHFNVKPAVWLDTLSMARAMFGLKGNSLAALAKKYNLEGKGTEVLNALGKRRADFSEQQFADYSRYCLHDVHLCHRLFELMSLGWYDLDSFDKRDPFPVQELKIIDRVIRMYTEPALRLNKEGLEQHLAGVIERKERLLVDSGVAKEDLMSNPKFAAVLESFGVAPPMKISPTNGKLTYAFAKTDPMMKELLEHPDERVQAVVAARMGVKSTLEETRTQRFISIATRGKTLPIPLKYSAARTHRLGGMDSINLQNLPSRGKDAGRIKSCIEAPPGYVVINCDSSNIEARMLAWLAEQEDLVTDFANGVDVYCKMASRIYGREVTKADKQERFVGKTVVLGCFASDTQVLTDSGWKGIVQVSLADRLWDGEEWVTHSGVVDQGIKLVEKPTDLMLAATADHEILTGHGWVAWSEVHSNPSLLRSALNKATLPSLVGSSKPGLMGALLGGTPAFSARADGPGLSTAVTLLTKKLSGAVLAPVNNLVRHANTTGGTLTSCLTTTTGRGFSTELLSAYTAVLDPHIKNSAITVGGVSLSTPNGLGTGKSFWPTSLASTDGIRHTLSWTVSTITKGMNRGIFAGLRAAKTWLTGGTYRICSKKSNVLTERTRTYDIALAGPRSRFTVMTRQGPLIVHNCGYQTGAVKLQQTLKTADPPMLLNEDESKRVIDIYRTSVPKIVNLWAQGEAAINAMYKGQTCKFGREGVLFVDGKRGIKLPSGLYLSYPQLHRAVNDKGREVWRYKDEKGLVDIYGGKLVENVTQALARIIVMNQLMRITKKLKVVLTVHDSVVVLAREAEAKPAQAFVEECMRWIPKWAAGCPINCESEYGPTYGDC